VRAHRLAADAVAPLSQLPSVAVIRPDSWCATAELIRYVSPPMSAFVIVLIVTQFVTMRWEFPISISLWC